MGKFEIEILIRQPSQANTVLKKRIKNQKSKIITFHKRLHFTKNEKPKVRKINERAHFKVTKENKHSWLRVQCHTGRLEKSFRGVSVGTRPKNKNPIHGRNSNPNNSVTGEKIGMKNEIEFFL